MDCYRVKFQISRGWEREHMSVYVWSGRIPGNIPCAPLYYNITPWFTTGLWNITLLYFKSKNINLLSILLDKNTLRQAFVIFWIIYNSNENKMQNYLPSEVVERIILEYHATTDKNLPVFLHLFTYTAVQRYSCFCPEVDKGKLSAVTFRVFALCRNPWLTAG